MVVNFKIKYTQKDKHLCLENLNTVIEKHPGIISNGMNSMGKTVLDSMFNKFKEKDKDYIVVSSNLLKPLVFYMDDNFLRCSETNKYLCCFSLNRLCCGGSPIFLSDQKEAAIYFDTDNLKNEETDALWFHKSRVYPTDQYPGIGAVISGGGSLIESGPMICYHNPNVPQRWTVSQKDHIKIEIQYI